MSKIPLQDAVARTGWAAVDGRDAIMKQFVFKDFVEAFGWMTQAAILAEGMNHHPEWSNVYKTVHVVLTTHDVDGVSELDVILAAKLDAL
ncbi:MAG: 4a-hydroxytetrahydrobiopterin dehydratase [Paracoccaceae bacterium]|uniref:4a-hydroxytetrahydrobiopterin dehydratase n=2 Tax=Thalassobacter stenotrophicus TaxID=266809 RepID=A0A0P1FI45_9RHOB|nr:4a-hydroxytetrahydrobiopterin dehydratase [Thalassobacter stenotrophicus]PVZ49823.1 4a-hydroxytetrahydrobiopterin dehydratase [Thalassobacter stenotrophicus]CUH59728.1 Putative pterin-4-alpha-carbinolamine dehydratase [Thalassobacter stenotrophicus]SHI90491.1 pterin-4-alpha-carbinolamine dehydratase [Thalassobacter stenotrophicus DSM 16310]